MVPEGADPWAWRVFDATSDAIVAVDADGRVRGWNRAAMRRYGYDSGATVGRAADEVPPFRTEAGSGRGGPGWLRRAIGPVDGRAGDVGSDAGRDVDPDAGAGEGAVSRGAQSDAPQGVTVLPATVDASGTGGALIVVPAQDGDGGDVAALERRLEEELALREAILEELPTGVRIATAGGELILNNRLATRMIGDPLVSNVLTADTSTRARRLDGSSYRTGELPLARALRGEVVRHEELTVTGPDGVERFLSVNAVPLRDEAGRVRAALVAFDDVTDHKNVEASLREARERVERTVERLRRTEEELRAVNERLKHEVLHDHLTGLPNRTLFLDRLGMVLSRRANDASHDAALLYLDFDHFKLVNDSLGHAAGDAMLVEVGRVLADVVRPEDTVARLGGDEFAILVDHLDGEREAIGLAERVQRAFETPIEAAGHPIYTSASIGIVPSVVGYDDADALLRDADTAMYRAKTTGRGRYRVFDTSMRAAAIAAMELENDLRKALARGEFRVRYAPIHRVADRALVGFEALVRWEHPRRGTLAPSAFLATATEMGIARNIDVVVWREAMAAAAAWRRRFGRRLTLAVNFSHRHFLSPHPERAFLDALRETGEGAADQTVLELEPGALHDPSDAMEGALDAIVATGVRVHLGGFGTDNAPLFSLRRFGIEGLKIDRSLVAELGGGPDDPGAEPVVLSVGVARTLRLDAIAEGVETERQLACLADYGCVYAQGHLFARPLDHDGAVAYLEASERAAQGSPSGSAPPSAT